jgi:hypothetical protein
MFIYPAFAVFGEETTVGAISITRAISITSHHIFSNKIQLKKLFDLKKK